MNHCYRKLVAYNPIENCVTVYKKMGEEYLFDGKASDEAFYDVYMLADKTIDMIIGVTLGGDLLQLSPAGYGTYIKEDSRTMKMLNKSRILVAIADYQKKNHIPFD